MQAPTSSYRAALATPGFGRMTGASLVGRGAEAMLTVVMVLFVLQRYRSPSLAGLTVFLFVGPGLVLSPVAGALLDRYGRVRLMTLDYALGAVALFAIALLSLAHSLPAAALLGLALVGGVTGMLSAAGMRSVVPLVLPEHLWGRGNAIDSSGYTLTILVGPALGGFMVGVFGPEVAILVAASLYIAAAMALIGTAEPGSRHDDSDEPLLRSALAGVRYVLRHPVLRAIAGSMTTLNIGGGLIVVALPVLVLGQLHGSSPVVGAMWALQGGGGAAAAFAFGRVRTRGRETRIVVLGLLGSAVGAATMALAPNLWVLALANLVAGAFIGPLDVTLFGVRQRVTGTRWLGRAIAISMSLNYFGFPLGSALSGPVVGVAPRLALAVAAVLTVVSAAIAAAWLRPTVGPPPD
ncbi:MAG: MFS transporter [Candidatus Dormibacteria bacterium]